MCGQRKGGKNVQYKDHKTGEKEEKTGHGSTEKVGGQAVLGRQLGATTPWLTERHGYDPTCTKKIEWGIVRGKNHMKSEAKRS